MLGVRIEGTGAMMDYRSLGRISPLRQNPMLKKIIVADSVTSIGDYAFQAAQA